MGAILALLVKRLAEGGFGKKPAAAYWWLAGKKTWIAFGLAVVAGALFMASQLGLCAPCYDYGASIAGPIAVGLAAVGLFDGAVRITPPQRPPHPSHAK